MTKILLPHKSVSEDNIRMLYYLYKLGGHGCKRDRKIEDEIEKLKEEDENGQEIVSLLETRWFDYDNRTPLEYFFITKTGKLENFIYLVCACYPEKYTWDKLVLFPSESFGGQSRGLTDLTFAWCLANLTAPEKDGTVKYPIAKLIEKSSELCRSELSKGQTGKKNRHIWNIMDIIRETEKIPSRHYHWREKRDFWGKPDRGKHSEYFPLHAALMQRPINYAYAFYLIENFGYGLKLPFPHEYQTSLIGEAKEDEEYRDEKKRMPECLKREDKKETFFDHIISLPENPPPVWVEKALKYIFKNKRVDRVRRKNVGYIFFRLKNSPELLYKRLNLLVKHGAGSKVASTIVDDKGNTLLHLLLCKQDTKTYFEEKMLVELITCDPGNLLIKNRCGETPFAYYHRRYHDMRASEESLIDFEPPPEWSDSLLLLESRYTRPRAVLNPNALTLRHFGEMNPYVSRSIKVLFYITLAVSALVTVFIGFNVALDLFDTFERLVTLSSLSVNDILTLLFFPAAIFDMGFEIAEKREIVRKQLMEVLKHYGLWHDAEEDFLSTCCSRLPSKSLKILRKAIFSLETFGRALLCWPFQASVRGAGYTTDYGFFYQPACFVYYGFIAVSFYVAASAELVEWGLASDTAANILLSILAGYGTALFFSYTMKQDFFKAFGNKDCELFVTRGLVKVELLEVQNLEVEVDEVKKTVPGAALYYTHRIRYQLAESGLPQWKLDRRRIAGNYSEMEVDPAADLAQKIEGILAGIIDNAQTVNTVRDEALEMAIFYHDAQSWAMLPIVSPTAYIRYGQSGLFFWEHRDNTIKLLRVDVSQEKVKEFDRHFELFFRQRGYATVIPPGDAGNGTDTASVRFIGATDVSPRPPFELQKYKFLEVKALQKKVEENTIYYYKSGKYGFKDHYQYILKNPLGHQMVGTIKATLVGEPAENPDTFVVSTQKFRSVLASRGHINVFQKTLYRSELKFIEDLVSDDSRVKKQIHPVDNPWYFSGIVSGIVSGLYAPTIISFVDDIDEKIESNYNPFAEKQFSGKSTDFLKIGLFFLASLVSLMHSQGHLKKRAGETASFFRNIVSYLFGSNYDIVTVKKSPDPELLCHVKVYSNKAYLRVEGGKDLFYINKVNSTCINLTEEIKQQEQSRYPHNVVYEKGKIFPEGKARGFYLCRDHDEKLYVLVVHNENLHERLCLTDIAKKSLLDELAWQEIDQNRQLKLDQALVDLIMSNCEHACWNTLIKWFDNELKPASLARTLTKEESESFLKKPVDCERLKLADLKQLDCEEISPGHKSFKLLMSAFFLMFPLAAFVLAQRSWVGMLEWCHVDPLWADCVSYTFACLIAVGFALTWGNDLLIPYTVDHRYHQFCEFLALFKARPGESPEEVPFNEKPDGDHPGDVSASRLPEPNESSELVKISYPGYGSVDQTARNQGEKTLFEQLMDSFHQGYIRISVHSDGDCGYTALGREDACEHRGNVQDDGLDQSEQPGKKWSRLVSQKEPAGRGEEGKALLPGQEKTEAGGWLASFSLSPSCLWGSSGRTHKDRDEEHQCLAPTLSSDVP